jgi:carbon-monoxide dehydrogenase iron sulfur subunit
MKPMRKIVWQEDVCIGCHLCEVHCLTAHSRYPNNIVKAYKRQFDDRPVARIVVEEKGATSFGLSCRHCTEPECVKSCLTGALSKDPVTGLVQVDTDRCIGCWTCVVSCPYGAIQPSQSKRRVAAKCDLCVGRDEGPACVQYCPNEALKLFDDGREG